MQFLKQLTDPALKRLYKFVLKRMIGRFLAADELDLDQLDVHLRSGRLELCDLLLSADVLNAELCEAQGLPFRVKKGYLGSVRVAISYASIMSESCLVEIDDIEIVLVPLGRDEAPARPASYAADGEEKAQEAGEEQEQGEKKNRAGQKKPAAPEPVDEISQEGLDFVASWIEQVTSKIKITLSNICLRLETGEQHNGRDVALLCKLQWAQFTDESASEVQSVYGRSSLDHPAGMYGSQTMGGGMQSMAASTLFGISQKGIKFRGISMDLHLSSEEEDEEDRWTERRRTEYSDMVLHPFLASDPSKQCYIQVKVSHYEALEAPAMDADVFFHSIRVVLQPQYFPELGTLVDAFSTDPAKLNAHHFEDHYTSAAMFKSICDDRPTWMTGSDDGEADGDGGALNLSFKEFQRIEQLLLQYRQTQDELQNAQRQKNSIEGDIPPANSPFIKGRKLSAAESVESIGLSDLEDEDDGFFDCDTGLASSIAPVPSPQTTTAGMYGIEEKTPEQPESENVLFTYHFAFQTLKVFQVSQWMGQLVSRVHVLAQNMTLLEEDGRANAVVPIIYRTPFGVSNAPIFFMGVDIADQTNEMREMKVELHLSHLSLRYDVRSKWLFQMLDMVLMEYPIPIIPLDSASMSDEEGTELFKTIKAGGNYDAVPLATAPKTVFTKLFVNFYDVIVDYSPLTLTSRVILVLGKVSVSSNVVTGAVMQGYKISMGDLELFLTQSRAGYEEIDEVLLGNDLFLRGSTKKSKKKMLQFADTYAGRGGGGSLDAEYPSLLTFLEKFGFLQIVTMDFVDVFLRVLVPPTALEVASSSRGQLEEKASASSASPELSVELNLGTANIYACFDSFNTLIELLSVWTDQLAIEQEPRDTTAYVGLDGMNDPSSVSVVTNLSPGPASSMRSIGISASESSVQGTGDFSSTSSVRSERISIGDSDTGGGPGRGFINILEQIDEDAFGGGKKIFPGKTVATDTEARLLRTRLDSIQKEKDRMVYGLEHDDQLSASELRRRYQQEERRKSSKPVRINELVIEDYYSDTRSFDGEADESAGAFLMESESDRNHNTTTAEDPWFSSGAPESPNGSLRMGSSPEKAAVLYNEQVARWLAPGGTRSDVGEGESGALSEASGEDFPLFEPIEEKPPVPSPPQTTIEPTRTAQVNVSYSNDDFEDEDEDDNFDANHFPMGAFPAASKNWWGMQNQPGEVELSDLQTEETASSFSHRMDLLEDRSVAHLTSSEAGAETTGDAHDDDVFPNAMSMSIIDAGEDEGKEVELDFTLDTDLQSRFNQLLDMESNSGHDVDDMDDDDDGDDDSDSEQRRPVYRQLQGEILRQNPSVSSSPRAIPTRQASFSSTSGHPSVPSSSFGVATVSPPDQPTARWFYDDQRSDDGGPPMTGPPSRIYPHHVEIPIGGSATSLSFGEKECEDAIRSIARENAVRKVEATAPIVVQHVLLRNFNICMRFFGGCDWTRDASEAVRLHPPKDDQHGEGAQGKQSDSATAKKEKLLDALLDNYVPSDGGDLFGNDNGSSLFTSAKSAPTTSFMKRDPATRTTRAASSDSMPATRKRSLKKSGRKTEEMLELVVTRIQLRLDMFNEAEAQPLASHTVLALGDVELLDYISTSQIRKIVCYWKSEATHPRESGSSMVRLQLITVRPGPNLCEEHRLKARLLPLRINLDQEVVKFLRQFVPTEEAPAPKKRPARRQIGPIPDDSDDEVEITMHEGGMEMKPIGESAPVEAAASLNAWFFQSIDIKPCKIKIDYRPNHVDYAALRAGDYLEVINLFVLEGMELVLRRVQMSGLDGWAALGENVLVSWVQDISRHQIHKCVASVSMPPLRPFVNIGAGAADLILLPMEHYGRDRRLVRGIKKGASSFLKSVTIETLNTASKVAQGTQALLEHADDVVSSSSALRRKQLKYRQAGSRIARNSRRMGGGGIRNAQDAGGGIGGRQYLAQQPASAAEGFGQAYDSLARELHVAAKTIVAVPLVEYKKTGSQGYVRSVIRAVPVAVLRPMIGASEAVAKALIGVRNAVDPELKEDIENKFKDFRAI
ncbi:Autophagy-related protein 2 [Phytophthora cinnamomi]|uniref:Autophagy-related protein 2 n=2 Tax=Phytophthora cinnamomi TaxID=4785 RepID=UPI003559F328|nr:Autophagy-related protein 2 [Phytophthora cinnamomi]